MYTIRLLREDIRQSLLVSSLTIANGFYQPLALSVLVNYSGDAAHAMVPFYGQGMNCGMEDCLVLDDFLQKHGNNLSEALKDFSNHRTVDAQAMCDLGKSFILFFRSWAVVPKVSITSIFTHMGTLLLHPSSPPGINL